MIEKISEKIGFTPTEVKVVLFFISVFIIGYLYKEFFNDEVEAEYVEYDYSEQDSLFNFYLNAQPGDSGNPLKKDKLEIKREVLELSTTDYSRYPENPPLLEKSININTAGIEELEKLPGIGEKTARKIIALRNNKGGFGNLDELLEVKGIGVVKFNKIKKFLYIE